MGIFDFFKKSDTSNFNTEITFTQNKNIESIKVLGVGCAKCYELENTVKQVVSNLALDIEVQHVDNFEQIAKYGVMSTPALVVNEKVLSVGKPLKYQEVIDILNKV